MKMSIHNKVCAYIDKYRVVSFSNLMGHFYYVSKTDMGIITKDLYKQHRIKYKVAKDKNPCDTLFFSRTFNSESATTVFENGYIAITKCLSVLEGFRKSYTIVYEELGFFPFVIRFGIKSNDEVKNIQLIYLPYSEENEFAKYIGGFVNENYDNRYNVIRFIVVEFSGMLKGESPQQIVNYIPRTQGFAICLHDHKSSEFFSLKDLGLG